MNLIFSPIISFFALFSLCMSSHTTDVLSFPSDEVDPETGSQYLGDIIISIPRAAQQAQVGGHSLEAEVQLLVVHGTLHLLGHDHAEAEEKARMWAAQAEVMGRLGLSHVKIQDT